MANTILSEPTSPNVTGTKLVYSVSSSNATQPQFQYVTDISISGSATTLTRLYTYPNPTGNGIIEISQILQDNLEYDNDWKTTGGTVSDEGFKHFAIDFYESYGTSISSSTQIYTASVASTTLEVFQGNVDPNNGVSFNYQDTSSFHVLSNQPTGSISKNNHVTVPVFVPPFSVVGTKELRFEYLDATGTLISASDTGDITGADYEIYQYSFGSGSSATRNDAFQNGDWEIINIYDSGSTTVLSQFERVRPCNGEETTFAFINNYGYFDYYTIPNPTRKVTNVERSNYEKPNVDYSSATSVYDVTERGETQYNTGYSDEFSITSDYLSKQESDWLTELIDSPEVYVQESGKFIPIVLTNSQYDWNLTRNRNKTFQYTFTYRYANQRYDR